MLSPELLARAVVSEPDWCNCTLASGEIDLDRLRAHIAEALRVYARQERERILEAIASVYHGDACRAIIRALE